MKVGVEERRLVIEAIATLAYRKYDMENFVLKPAAVPAEIYTPLRNQRDEFGRRLSKRQTAPLILEALEGRDDYVDIVENIVKIAANWERFELCDKEYDARAVKAKAQEVWKRHQALEAEEAAQKEAVRQEQHRNYLAVRERELSLLLSMFDEMAGPDQDVQERGYGLQQLLNRLFDAYGIPVHKSFTRNQGGEQIDGAFEINGWYYLCECRWRQKLTDMREIDGLLGQVSRSGKQTMGFFVSISGWSENVPGLLKQNADKAIILMQGYDLRTILSGEADLQEYLSAALTHLNIRAEPYLGVREFMNRK